MAFDTDLYRRTIKLPSRTTNGRALRMSVVDAGPPDALRTIVFLHGMGGYAGYWHFQLGHFYEGSRVIAPDLRGHGLTDAPLSDYTRDELLADIEALLAAIGAPERFILVTHSFGGALGTVFTTRHPERVEKLVIIGSAVRFDKLKNAGRFLLKAPRWLLSSVFTLLPVGKRYPPGHVIHAQYKSAVITYDGTELLKTIACPTLVILGQRDRLFDTSAYQAIAKLIPGAQEVTLPLSAHQVMVERPDAVNRALDRFLGPLQIAEERKLRRERDRALEMERPWLKYYDGRTPYRIRPPQGPLQRHLEVAARRFPHVVAVQFMHKQITYRRLDRLANRFADGLLKQGLQRGDRVLVMLPNIPQAVIAYFATLKAGGVVSFLDPRASVDLVRERIQALGANVVIALTVRYGDLHQSALDAGAKRVVFTAFREYMAPQDWIGFSLRHHYQDGHAMPYLRVLASDRRVFRFHELLSLKTERPEPEPSVDDLALIQYTAATDDAQPKAVALSHRNLMANSLQIRHWIPEARPADERILAVWPFTAGLAGTANIAPMLGATLILMPRFEPLEVLNAIRQHRPTILPAVPRMYQMLAAVPNIRKYGVASIRVCVAAGAALPLEVQEAFEKLTKGLVLEAYNTAESGVALTNPLAARKRSGAIGVPLPDVEARVVNAATGSDCAPDEAGELWLRGPQVAAGYWQNAELTAKHFRGGWFATGDIARRDEDGFFYLLDRQQDVIHVASEVIVNDTGEAALPPESSTAVTPKTEDIYPREIEEVLYELQEIVEAAVVAWTTDAGKLEIVAFIVLRAGAAFDDGKLSAWCAQRLSVGARPTRFKRIEKLPRSPTGKVLRRELRALEL